MKRILRSDGLLWRQEREGPGIRYSYMIMRTSGGVLSRGNGLASKGERMIWEETSIDA